MVFQFVIGFYLINYNFKENAKIQTFHSEERPQTFPQEDENQEKIEYNQKIFMRLPTFAKNRNKNEVLQINTTNIAICSYTQSKKTTQIATNKQRRNSNLKNISSSPLRFEIQKNSPDPTKMRPSFFCKKIESKPDFVSLKSPVHNQCVISFNDVSAYKTNLIDFFREEEEKEQNKKSKILLKGIIKKQRKELGGTFNKSSSPKSTRHSVYLRFQDQIKEIAGLLFLMEIIIKINLNRGET